MYIKTRRNIISDIIDIITQYKSIGKEIKKREKHDFLGKYDPFQPITFIIRSIYIHLLKEKEILTTENYQRF